MVSVFRPKLVPAERSWILHRMVLRAPDSEQAPLTSLTAPLPPGPTEKDWPHADCRGSRGARNREGGPSSLSQGQGTPAKTTAAPCRGLFV